MVSDLTAETMQYLFSMHVESWQGMDGCGGIGGRSAVLLPSALQELQHVDFTI